MVSRSGARSETLPAPCARAGPGRFDTPFKWAKQVASHRGGTARACLHVLAGPHHGRRAASAASSAHVIDILPTILEATGISAPDTINGIKQRPIEGASMVYTWDKAKANAPTRHTTQDFETLGDRAIYHDGWVAVDDPGEPSRGI